MEKATVKVSRKQYLSPKRNRKKRLLLVVMALLASVSLGLALNPAKASEIGAEEEVDEHDNMGQRGQNGQNQKVPSNDGVQAHDHSHNQHQHHRRHHHHNNQRHQHKRAFGGPYAQLAPSTTSNQQQFHQLLGHLPDPMALVGAQAQAQNQALVRQVNPGDRVNIPCSLSNLGGSIQFAKDDQAIVLDSGCAHCQLDISNDGQASLTINRVQLKDQGHWQCWRLDVQGKVKQKIPILKLEVTNSPELPVLVVNDKELLAGNNLDATVTVRENEIVTFKCIIRGATTPVDYVHWMLDSSQNVTQMSQLMEEYSQQETNYITSSLLKLNATKSMNLKSVSCLSNHRLWLTPMTVTAFLNVLYEPSFTISREPGFGTPVTEGMSVTLKCEIDSNPSSSPIWIKDAENKTSSSSGSQTQANPQQTTGGGGGPHQEPLVLENQDEGSVTFSPARRSDSGWYRCKTENKYGNFSSFGYYLMVRSPMAGDSPAVSVPQSPTPAPQVTARQHQHQHQTGRILAPNQSAATQVPSGSRTSQTAHLVNQMNQNDQPAPNLPYQNIPPPPSQLTSNPFSSSPDGVQRNCKPSKVDGAPVFEQPVSQVSALLGRQLILHLKFCCNPAPTRVFWIHRHLAMIPGRMFGPYITREIYTSYNEHYCYESTFEIETVKPEDIGTLYVFVSNEKGHAGAQIHIQLAKLTGGDHQAALGSTRYPLTPQASSALSQFKATRNMQLVILNLLATILVSLYLHHQHTFTI